ncbi:hypothetical protein [Kiloniella majae]|uniref:hypothetical protein n=1 Tax=Kiloniella majae TaxID=1938558 RepID=UPI000A276F19|nr:hypothetical protein [Kiloniella majae]
MPTTEQLETRLAEDNITHQTFGISKRAYGGVVAYQLEKHGFNGALKVIKQQVQALQTTH